MSRGVWFALAGLAWAAVCCACGPTAARPVAIDTRNDACGSCRMLISAPRFASQIVVPGEEPLLFDDLRCLRDHLRAAGTLPPRAAIFVADHRTGAWVPATRALFVDVPDLETPMGSHWVAYADETSRGADPYAASGSPLPRSEILGPTEHPETNDEGAP